MEIATLFKTSATTSHQLFSSISPTPSDQFVESSSLPIHPMPSDEFITHPLNILSDNSPISILLCTRKGKKMVEYALTGMDNQLFVSTYMLQLPDKSTLEKFLLDEIEKHDDEK